jgi:hypothetical protein
LALAFGAPALKPRDLQPAAAKAAARRRTEDARESDGKANMMTPISV